MGVCDRLLFRLALSGAGVVLAVAGVLCVLIGVGLQPVLWYSLGGVLLALGLLLIVGGVITCVVHQRHTTRAILTPSHAQRQNRYETQTLTTGDSAL